MKSSTSEPAVSRWCGAHELFECRAQEHIAQWLGVQVAALLGRTSERAAYRARHQQTNYRWGVWRTLVRTATLQHA